MDFYTIGILIVRPIIQNDEDPLSKPVKAFVENEAPLEVSFIRLTDEWHRFLPNYLQVMAGTKKFGLMYKHYRKLCLEHEAMAITDPTIRQSFLQFANAMNDQEIIEKLSE